MDPSVRKQEIREEVRTLFKTFAESKEIPTDDLTFMEFIIMYRKSFDESMTESVVSKFEEYLHLMEKYSRGTNYEIRAIDKLKKNIDSLKGNGVNDRNNSECD